MSKPTGDVLDALQIARVCHEANRAYCQTIGDESQKPWDEAEDWQKESAIAGIVFALNNPGITPREQHAAWVRNKEAQGWRWGKVKDSAKREHPLMVPYEQLPPEQRFKDVLFRAIVMAFAGDELKESLVTVPRLTH